MRKYCYIFLALLPIFISCDKIGRDGVDEKQYVYLGANILEQEETRAPYMDTAPSGNNPLEVAVWASTVKGYYPESADSPAIAAHTEARFANNDMQLLNGVLYPAPAQDGTATPIYFVSLYPQEGWSNPTDDYSKAQFKFNGSQDVMFAPEVSGYYDIQPPPTLSFKHLLTLFNVKIGMDPLEANAGVSIQYIREAWGNIQNIYIKRVDQSTIDFLTEHVEDVTINLLTSTKLKVEAEFVASVQPASLGTWFYKVGENKQFPGGTGYEITSNVTHVAYTMCAPTNATVKFGDTNTATPEYVLTIVTKKGEDVREIEIVLDLMESKGNEPASLYSGSTSGKQFDITLYFKKSKTIRHTVEVTSWETGGYGHGNLYD